MVSPRKPIVEWPQSYYWHWYNQPILFSMFFNFLLLFISFPPSPHIRVYNLFSLFLILPQKHCLSEASTSGPAHFQAPSLWPGQWTTKFQPVSHFYLLLFFLLALIEKTGEDASGNELLPKAKSSWVIMMALNFWLHALFVRISNKFMKIDWEGRSYHSFHCLCHFYLLPWPLRLSSQTET